MEGKYAQAETLFQWALSTLQKTNGVESIDVANTLNNLGELYRTQKKYADAQPQFERAISIYEKSERQR